MHRKAKRIECLLCSRGHFFMRGLRMDRNFDAKLRPKSPNQNVQFSLALAALQMRASCRILNECTGKFYRGTYVGGCIRAQSSIILQSSILGWNRSSFYYCEIFIFLHYQVSDVHAHNHSAKSAVSILRFWLLAARCGLLLKALYSAWNRRKRVPLMICRHRLNFFAVSIRHCD